MTKKDYIGIARILRDARRFHATYDKEGYAIVRMTIIESGLAALFSEDNPKFDRERFLKATNQ